MLTIQAVARRSGVAASALHYYEARGLLAGERAPSGRRLSTSWRRRIDARIGELQRMRDSLSECIGCGCLSLERCRLANPGDRLGASGSGPRHWIEAGP